jgi:hypothetical protein
MKGHIRQRGKRSFELKFDAGSRSRHMLNHPMRQFG